MKEQLIVPYIKTKLVSHKYCFHVPEPDNKGTDQLNLKFIYHSYAGIINPPSSLTNNEYKTKKGTNLATEPQTTSNYDSVCLIAHLKQLSLSQNPSFKNVWHSIPMSLCFFFQDSSGSLSVEEFLSLPQLNKNPLTKVRGHKISQPRRKFCSSQKDSTPEADKVLELHWQVIKARVHERVGNFCLHS